MIYKKYLTRSTQWRGIARGTFYKGIANTTVQLPWENTWLAYFRYKYARNQSIQNPSAVFKTTIIVKK